MAEFEVKVYQLTIEEHPNADALELARVGDYRAIVRTGQYKTGDLGVYIPEAAIVPEWLITELGLEGRLAGKNHNRVKAIRLRGILSQGLIYPLERHPENVGWRFAANGRFNGMLVAPGEDVTKTLGITKYEPPIPVHMAGEVCNLHGKTLKYDIENIKKYPNVFEDGEEVVITEKIHGTWCCFGHHPDVDHSIVTSKGLSAQGLAFKLNEANVKNLYVRALYGTGSLLDRLCWRLEQDAGIDLPVYILGEVYGQGVQDLQYGAKTPQFRVFDIYVGEPGHGLYLDSDRLEYVCHQLEIERVPTVYKGPFSKEIVEKFTSGKETVSGQETNMREGVVITPVKEREHIKLGRVKLKSVSEQYLLRKGGTEFN